ncbi:MAG: hypothetical protein M3232_03660 [Thermoproteota archaeon]|nr:hypothetical protein [Thermoproteota archaeon]
MLEFHVSYSKIEHSVKSDFINDNNNVALVIVDQSLCMTAELDSDAKRNN